MYISRVRLENVRCFSGRRNVDLDLTRPDGSYAGWTVLAGRNGAGKTSLLRAIAYAIGGPNVWFAFAQESSQWIAMGEQEATAEIDLHAEHADLDTRGYRVDDVKATLTWSAPTGLVAEKFGDRAMPAMSATTAPDIGLDGPWAPNPWGWFFAAYGPYRRLYGGDESARRLMKGPGPLPRYVSLFNDDASLSEGIEWLIRRHLRAFEGHESDRVLKEGALKLLADGLFPEYRISEVTSDGLWVVSRSGDRFPLAEMSEGYRASAALVVDLLKNLHSVNDELFVEDDTDTPLVSDPGVVLIDEIDAHLHPSWQQRIGDWLTEHFPSIQFIVTTHSPYICQTADPGGLIRLPGPQEDEPPQVVDQDLYDRVVYGSADDAFLSELFGLETIYSERAEQLRREVIALETKVMRDTASESETERYLALRRQLNSSPSARADEVSARLRGTAE